MTYTEDRARMLDIVREAGLNGDNIRADGIDRDGYDEFAFDDDGGRAIQEGVAVTVRRAWPKSFPYDEFIEYYNRVILRNPRRADA